LPDANYRKANEFKYGQTDSVRQRFTGYQKDAETNLDFAEARMYETRHARFTAVDPLLASGKSANPQTFNRFVYCLNNPLSYTDPSGLQVGHYRGKVWVDKAGDNFSNYEKEGYTLYTGAPQIITASDNYRYQIRSNGWRELGKAGKEPTVASQMGQSVSDTVIGGSGAAYNAFASLVNGTNFVANRLDFGYIATGRARETFGSLDYFEPATPGEQSAALAANISLLLSGGFTSATRSTPSFSGFTTETGTALAFETLPASELKFTDQLRRSSLNKNADSIYLYGVQEPVQYTVINGEKYLLDGNHRTALALKFGQTVPARRQSLPFGAWKNEEEVLQYNAIYGNPFRESTFNKFLKYYKPPKKQ
jgi:RHS repeat-associated protein